ncbi:MAG: hypothetical protein ACJ798_16805 [Phenylobacterium sp.]
MRTFTLVLLAGAALAQSAALPARAQQPAAVPPTADRPASKPDDDIIGSLLDPRHKPTKEEEEEPDTAGQKVSPEPEPSLVPAPGPPAAAVPYAAAPRPQLDRPVRIEETGKTPDRPPGVRDLAYDSRIRSSFAAAESFQGPLDGGWTLADARGGDRYAFQIVERRDRLEAVWRDVRRKGSLTASGVVDQIQHTGPDLTLRFAAADGAASVVTLREAGQGRWMGKLARGSDTTDVILRRTGP